MVQLKKKVTLKTKKVDSDIKQDIQSKDTASQEPVKNSNGGNKRNLWIFLGIIALVVILSFVFLGKNKGSKSQLPKDNGGTVVKIDSIKPTEDNTETTDSISVTKEDSALKKDSVNLTPEKSSNEDNSNNGSTTNVAKDELKPQNSSSEPLNGSLEQKAIAVIRGTYGNGLERKQKLGNEYTVIQNKVNEMYRDGLVD
jgi:uncharacterized membrane protein YdfJ with MMPL/SSD domain